MKTKQKKSILSSLTTLKSPNASLEQYSTPPEISLDAINLINENINLKNKTILDMCCGTGMLMITSFFCDPLYVVGIDICKESLSLCKNNIEMFEKFKIKNLRRSKDHEYINYHDDNNYLNYDLIRADGSTINFNSFKTNSNLFSSDDQFIFDVCLMNPPFANVHKKIDTKIINNVLKVSKVLFVFHSSQIKAFFKRKYYCEVLAEIQFELKRVCFYHKKDRKDIKVCLFKITGKK
ncbi:Methyltransferase-like protein 5 [Dictyocoela muelleri]|nr:Methyltransferase-like protein 5 [Dictyocoela muelleri]